MNLINRFWDGLHPLIQGCIIGLAVVHLFPLLVLWMCFYIKLLLELM